VATTTRWAETLPPSLRDSEKGAPGATASTSPWRNSTLFAERGYAAQQIQPVDLFPRTAHVETVVLLTHNSQGAK
ncbi:hypothetical protein, partial [Bittarella massiliensis (ex Durand et al. 2017)]